MIVVQGATMPLLLLLLILIPFSSAAKDLGELSANPHA
jgi:hypothetical protein